MMTEAADLTDRELDALQVLWLHAQLPMPGFNAARFIAETPLVRFTPGQLADLMKTTQAQMDEIFSKGSAPEGAVGGLNELIMDATR